MKNLNKISASILSANLTCLSADINKVLKLGINRLHFDVMDYHYVPNLTFGPLLLRSLRDNGINTYVDVHLMSTCINNFTKEFSKLERVSSIVFHPEACKNINYSLSLIKDSGIESGLALSPNTNFSIVKKFLHKIDRILVLGVNPGFSSQIFIESTYPKIRYLSSLIKDVSRKIIIEVDGGVNLKNISYIESSGASSFVMGSAIFNSSNYKYILKKISEKLG